VNKRIEKALPRLVHFTASSINETIWNVMGIYRDKTVHWIGMRTVYEKSSTNTNPHLEHGRFVIHFVLIELFLKTRPITGNMRY